MSRAMPCDQLAAWIANWVPPAKKELDMYISN